MYMKDWLETIDDYLKMTRRDILTSSGHISHIQAIKKLMQNMINNQAEYSCVSILPCSNISSFQMNDTVLLS